MIDGIPNQALYFYQWDIIGRRRFPRPAMGLGMGVEPPAMGRLCDFLEDPNIEWMIWGFNTIENETIENHPTNIRIQSVVRFLSNNLGFPRLF